MTSRIDRLLFPWKENVFTWKENVWGEDRLLVRASYALMPYNSKFEMASIAFYEDQREQYTAYVYTTPVDNSDELKVTKTFSSLDEAKRFAEQELINDGWEIMTDKLLLLV